MSGEGLVHGAVEGMMVAAGLLRDVFSRFLSDETWRFRHFSVVEELVAGGIPVLTQMDFQLLFGLKQVRPLSLG